MTPGITTDVFVIPVGDRHLVYAPLRRVAFIASAPVVNLLHRLRQGEIAAPSPDEAAMLAFFRQVRLTGREGDWPISTYEWASFQPTEVTLFLTTRLQPALYLLLRLRRRAAACRDEPAHSAARD